MKDRSHRWGTALAAVFLWAGGHADPAIAATKATVLSGRVQDPDGKPLEHVYIRQDGGLTSVFSDERGAFVLRLDPAAGDEILASAPGRSPVRAAIGALAGSGGTIVLAPLPVVEPPASTAPGADGVAPDGSPAGSQPWAPSPVDVAAPEGSLLDTHFGIRGDWRRLAIGGPENNKIDGSVDGEVALSAAFRTADWLIRLGAERSRASVRLPDLTVREGDATYAPETVEAVVGVEYLFRWPGFTIAPYGVTLYRSVQAGASRAAYSGTALDWDQTRYGLGAGVEAAAALPWGLEGTFDLSVYPLMWARLTGAPLQPAGLNGGRAGLGLGYFVHEGLRVDLAYRHDLWRAADHAEDSDVVAMGLTYFPGRRP